MREELLSSTARSNLVTLSHRYSLGVFPACVSHDWGPMWEGEAPGTRMRDHYVQYRKMSSFDVDSMREFE